MIDGFLYGKEVSKTGYYSMYSFDGEEVIFSKIVRIIRSQHIEHPYVFVDDGAIFAVNDSPFIFHKLYLPDVTPTIENYFINNLIIKEIIE